MLNMTTPYLTELFPMIFPPEIGKYVHMKSDSILTKHLVELVFNVLCNVIKLLYN